LGKSFTHGSMMMSFSPFLTIKQLYTLKISVYDLFPIVNSKAF